jgi:ABC-type polysaccharide/polyol phosphate transport system ATPase subunit
MEKNIALSIKNVSKTFRIPHEKVSSLRGAFTQALKGKTTYEEFKALDDVSFEDDIVRFSELERFIDQKLKNCN